MHPSHADIIKFFIAVRRDDQITIRSMVKRCPKLINVTNTSGFTALRVAANTANLSLMRCLLDLKASPHIGDCVGTTPFIFVAALNNLPMMNLLLEYQTSVFTATITDMLQLLDLIAIDPVGADKIKCINLLLAQGVGLCADFIPDSVLTLYNLQREKLGPLLLLVEQRTPDNQWKKSLISHLSQFKDALDQPNGWRLNTDSIARALQFPAFSGFAHIQEMKRLLPLTANDPTPITCVLTEADLPSFDNIARCTSAIKSKIGVFEGFETTSTQVKEQLAAHENHVELVIQNFFAIIRHQTTLSLKQKSERDKIEMMLGHLMSMMMPIFGFKNNQPQAKALLKRCLLALDVEIESILKLYNNELQQKMLDVYNSLIDARVVVLMKLARLDLDTNPDLALNQATLALAINEKVVITNPSLGQSVKMNRVHSLNTLTDIYISRGWFMKARKWYFEAIKLCPGLLYDDIFVRVCKKLLSYHFEKGKFIHAYELVRALEVYLTNMSEYSVAPQFKQEFDEAKVFCTGALAKLKSLKSQQQASKHQKRLAVASTVDKAEVASPVQEEMSPSEDELRAMWQRFEALKTTAQASSPSAPPTPSNPYGFKIPDGFSPLIAIDNPAVPKETLFISMPENNNDFLQFYPLVRDRQSGQYFDSIRSIDPKGKGQHGAKLTTQWMHEQGKQPYKKPIVRLKASGTLRAVGFAEQCQTDEQGKQRTLYLIQHVVDKKQEQRKGYVYKNK